MKGKQERELRKLLGEVSDKKKRTKIIKRVKGRLPILAPYVNSRFQIRYRYKDKTHKATVIKDGTIYYKGRIYNSPSLAARAITGHGTNGWVVWNYERAPGYWVLLDNLRK